MGRKVKFSMFVEVHVDEDELKELYEDETTEEEKNELDPVLLWKEWYMNRIENEINNSVKDSDYLGKIINFVDFDCWHADEIDE